jgi:hypothetical protein
MGAAQGHHVCRGSRAGCESSGPEERTYGGGPPETFRIDESSLGRAAQSWRRRPDESSGEAAWAHRGRSEETFRIDESSLGRAPKSCRQEVTRFDKRFRNASCS